MSALSRKVDLNMAVKIINAMIMYANDNGLLPGSYAVVDEGGHVVAFERRDEAPAATADIAIDKAWTAATMKASGRILEIISKGQGWRLNVKHKGRLTIIPGAVPIIANARVIGGVGHSGGSAEDDLKIAQAGWTAIFREENFNAEVEERLSLARKIAKEVIEEVDNRKLKPVTLAVVDEWGHPTLIYRIDGAPFGTLELARDKAWTAVAFKTLSENVSSLYSNMISATNWNERLTPIPGGVPFMYNNKFVGAIGIAGNMPEEDKNLAINVIKKVGLELLG
ncbi:MAG: heme-binding protein [Caldisphaeraceae archaeon]|nr:heme-binding protein [Caldisphaeraceae archaeon]